MVTSKSNSYIIHFQTRLKRTDRNKLTRKNYCIPTNKVNYTTKKYIQYVQEFYIHNKKYPSLCPPWFCNIPNDTFSDSEHYTDDWVKNQYNACMQNFDLNMQYFSSLSKEKFDKYLETFIKRNKFRQVEELKSVSKIEGVYILVLDEYKQVYIGISEDIKKRILQHWSNKKEFDRLLCGKIEESILSIDSFGALDTTRIYYKPYHWSDKDKAEENYISQFKSTYLLNRVTGGINEEDSSLRNLLLINNIKKRKLDD